MPTPTPTALALLLVAAGGALGGVCRWLLARIPAPRVGTFVANVAAAGVLGFAVAAPGAWPLVAGTGFAGALSTWSTLAKELGTLITKRDYRACARYALLTALVGTAAAAMGLMWGQVAFGA